MEEYDYLSDELKRLSVSFKSQTEKNNEQDDGIPF